MKLRTSEEWISVESELRSPKKIKRMENRSIALIVGFGVGLVALITLAWWGFTVMESSGESRPYLDLGVWEAFICISILLTGTLLICLLKKGCYNLLLLVILGLFLSILLWFMIRSLIEATFLLFLLPSVTGNLHLIASIFIAVHLIESALFILFLWSAMKNLRSEMMRCDIAEKGIDLPTRFISSDDGKVRVAVPCKIFKGNKLCKITNVRGIEE